MQASSVSVGSGAPARAAGTPKTGVGLRRLRLVLLAAALACAAALPFELGLWRAHVKPAIISVHNYPRTAVVGHTERFSVRLAGMAHARLTYVLQYPDGHVDRASVRADANGYSSYTFRIHGYTPKHWRETAWVGVENKAGTLKASLDFAIQKRRQ